MVRVHALLCLPYSTRPDSNLLNEHAATRWLSDLVALEKYQAYHKIPVVMMSAAATTAEINDCYKAGANSFFHKHMDLAPLKETISTLGQYWFKLD